MTRREAMRRVTVALGGAALVGGDALLAFSFDAQPEARRHAQGVGTFTAADIALLDEIAETILPETSTPGAKAAKTGAFMALMVTAAYTERNQQVFRDGMRAAGRSVPEGKQGVVHAGLSGAATHAARSARPRAENGDGRTRGRRRDPARRQRCRVAMSRPITSA